MPTLLADLINAIPVVGRGDVISPESHNSRRDAIVAIVTELGGAVASRNVTLTFAPAFLPVPPGAAPPPEWQVNVGFAQSTGLGQGWLPVQLPDASRIQQLRVFFGGTGQLVTKLHVKLQRQTTDIRSKEDLADLSVQGPIDLEGVKKERIAPFTTDKLIFPQPGREPADIVNNKEFKYFVRAELEGDLPSGSVLKIFAIRVDCRLG
jgi:hypothetical protein